MTKFAQTEKQLKKEYLRKINALKEAEKRTPKVGDLIEMPHTNSVFYVADIWANCEEVRATLQRTTNRGKILKSKEIEILYYIKDKVKIWQPYAPKTK